MKITRQTLKKLIQEELNEAGLPDIDPRDVTYPIDVPDEVFDDLHEMEREIETLLAELLEGPAVDLDDAEGLRNTSIETLERLQELAELVLNRLDS